MSDHLEQQLKLATQAVAIHAIALALVTDGLSLDASMSKQLYLAILHEATDRWKKMSPDELAAFLQAHYPYSVF